jgi:hypothetical protein
MRRIYDARMRLTGQNGLSDYDRGFTDFLYTFETSATALQTPPPAGSLHRRARWTPPMRLGSSCRESSPTSSRFFGEPGRRRATDRGRMRAPGVRLAGRGFLLPDPLTARGGGR